MKIFLKYGSRVSWRRLLYEPHDRPLSADLLPFCWGRGMKLVRQQVLGSVLIALIVLGVLLIRAWPLLFRK